MNIGKKIALYFSVNFILTVGCGGGLQNTTQSKQENDKLALVEDRVSPVTVAMKDVNNKVQAVIPAGQLAVSSQVAIDKTIAPSEFTESGFQSASTPIELNIRDANGNKVEELSSPMTLAISFDKEAFANSTGLAESNRYKNMCVLVKTKDKFYRWEIDQLTILEEESQVMLQSKAIGVYQVVVCEEKELEKVSGTFEQDNTNIAGAKPEINNENRDAGQLQRWDGSQWMLLTDKDPLYQISNAEIPKSSYLFLNEEGVYVGQSLAEMKSNLKISDSSTSASDISLINLGDLQDVSLSNIKNGDLLSWNGKNWISQSLTPLLTWDKINKTNSKIEDMANVSKTAATIGQVLKWNGTAWSPSADVTGASSSAVDSTLISDGTIVDADISSSANISQSKISGLATVLSSKQNVIAAGTSSQYLKGDLSLGVLDTNSVTEGSNLYFTALRAKSATVSDSINDAILDVAPSQNAVFDALAVKGDFKSDGTVSMVGDLNLSSNHSAAFYI